MRSVNVIAGRIVAINEVAIALRRDFCSVVVEHSEIKARHEGHAPGQLNHIVIESDLGRAYILDRPTTIREYELPELEALRERIGEPATFVAIDYSSETVLSAVLASMARLPSLREALVDAGDGPLVPLASFLGR